MANWDKIKSKGNVEDRRASRVVGGIGILTIAIALAIGYFNGADSAINFLGEAIQNQPVQERQIDNSEFSGEDKYELFAKKVMGVNDNLWGKSFKNNGIKFEKPKLVLFRGATQSVCGGATSQSGPHYCSLDKNIYLDETFFEEMKRNFGAKGGDVAQAYVISHEYGHHIQNLLGITKKVRNNTDSIKLELQADCFAGIALSTISNIFEENEIYEAIDAASSVGDDRIQKRMTGQVHPESWTHGSSKQRKYYFSVGYKYADFGKCDTFK